MIIKNHHDLFLNFCKGELIVQKKKVETASFDTEGVIHTTKMLSCELMGFSRYYNQASTIFPKGDFIL